MEMLSDEQVEALRVMCPPPKKLKDMTPDERKEYQRTTKARSRANAKSAAEKEKARLAGETVQAHWKRQLAALERTSPKKLAALREREDEVWSIIWSVESIMRSVDNGLLLLEDAQADMESIGKGGLVAVEATQARDRYWQNEEFMSQVARMNTPTQTFLKYGLVVGLPTSTAYHWTKFMERQGHPIKPFPLNPVPDSQENVAPTANYGN